MAAEQLEDSSGSLAQHVLEGQGRLTKASWCRLEIQAEEDDGTDDDDVDER